jgi:hypothetical protein
MEGFTVTLTEQAGDIVVDAFGNKLATTYQFTDLNSNGKQDPGEPYVLGPDCAPIIVAQGAGEFTTPANGEVVIKNRAPGKCGRGRAAHRTGRKPCHLAPDHHD